MLHCSNQLSLSMKSILHTSLDISPSTAYLEDSTSFLNQREILEFPERRLMKLYSLKQKKNKKKFYMYFMLVLKCVDVKSRRMRMVYHIPVTFPRFMVSGKLSNFAVSQIYHLKNG